MIPEYVLAKPKLARSDLTSRSPTLFGSECLPQIVVVMFEIATFQASGWLPIIFVCSFNFVTCFPSWFRLSFFIFGMEPWQIL